jgi:hypothetical protein
MRVCTSHPHSGEKSARRCYEKAMQKRADRKMRSPPTPLRIAMEYHRPYRVASRGGIELFVFSEDANTPY